MNRFIPPALPLYRELYDIVKDKEYFVLTTNVDHQFYKAGFAFDRIFATQGDYGKIQCQSGVNPRVIEEYLKSLITDFVRKVLTQKDCEKELNKASKEIEDDKEINEKDYSIVNQTAMTLMELSDRECKGFFVILIILIQQ